MGGVAISAQQPVADVLEAIDELFGTQGAQIQTAVEAMRATHGTMLKFLAQI
jgi:hypothetical protein